MLKFSDQIKRDVQCIIWLALSIFWVLALATYNPSDPSLNNFSKLTKIASVQNVCGYFGSVVSDLAYDLFGIVAWGGAILFLRLAYIALKNKGQKTTALSAFWIFLLHLFAAGLLALHFPTTKIIGGHVDLGGSLGVLLSHGLVGIFNKIGAGIIFWAGFAILLTFYTEMSIKDLFGICGNFLKNLSRKLEDLINQKEKPSQTIAPKLDTAPQVEKEVKAPLFKLLPEKKEKEKVKIQRNPDRVENWQMPSVDLLVDAPRDGKKADDREVHKNAKVLEQKLAEFDVTGEVVEIKPGPAVTMFEFRPAASVKINEITKLNDDLSLALSAESLRIIAPIPGRDVVGIETSNSSRQAIFMKDLLEAPEFWSQETKLPVALGKSATGEPKIVDLRRLPHLLVAGTTGSGKSVFVMSLVTSLIMRHSPKTLKLVIIDPKQVDLSAFHKIPHLLMPPVKEVKPAVNTLKWLVREMEKRYRSLSQLGSKNIEGFNEAINKLASEAMAQLEEKNKAFEQKPQTQSQTFYTKPLPYIVAVIEEFADLMSVDRVGVEPLVVRLAQMARAAGIHIVLAMQSPRREVLTGLIKTNFPGRISFKVASKVDSTIILDSRGAERLLSVGDMLYLAPGISQPQRYHGAFLKDEEITAVTDFWIKQGQPEFEETAVKAIEDIGDAVQMAEGLEAGFDEEYDQVVAYVTTQKEVSASLLQRRFRFGYPKAARLIEMLESEGVVGPSNGSKPRAVIAQSLE